MSILLSPSRLAAVAQLLATFLVELVKSATRVAAAVLSPNVSVKPAVVAVPIDLKTDLGIATLANLVTLTPGTTSLHVSETRDTLYVHVLDSPSADAVIADIKGTFERLIKRIEG
ncbi:Na+/H+ antiporter subunit E [Salinarimonas rosea]|uniref:Na+/H+ antiporter subunit E n=1 Tax=Salinarimonas rosea TaxID=552063 RepID=UPI00041E3867|nr:Na+/H+ antiporter subunit E [Salinarimonas rosea]